MSREAERGEIPCRTVSQFSIDDVKPGHRAHFWVRIVHGGMGRSVDVPVIVLRGARPGPTLGLTAALHGDELNGIPVIHRLVDPIDLRTLRGSVVAAVVANVPSFHLNQRRFPDGVDLNHIMPGVPDGNDSQVYAHRLFERIVRRVDYLIDLHTASEGRVNSLYVRADMTDPRTARMAYLQRPQIILHNPPSDRTLRGAADDAGIPAITVEIGDPQVFQPRHIKPTVQGIRRLMTELRMLPRRSYQEGPAPLLCRRSRWLYTDHGGFLEVFPAVTDRVARGDRIARQRDVFGEIVREYVAPEDGIVIGKAVNPVGPTGARILHLGQESEPESEPFARMDQPLLSGDDE